MNKKAIETAKILKSVLGESEFNRVFPFFKTNQEFNGVWLGKLATNGEWVILTPDTLYTFLHTIGRSEDIKRGYVDFKDYSTKIKSTSELFNSRFIFAADNKIAVYDLAVKAGWKDMAKEIKIKFNLR